MAHRILQLVLALNILATSVGFTVYARQCKMRGDGVTLFADIERCCAHHGTPPPAQPKAPERKSCCSKRKGAHKGTPVRPEAPATGTCPTKAPVAFAAKSCCTHTAHYIKGNPGSPITLTKETVKPLVPVAAILPAPAMRLDLPHFAHYKGRILPNKAPPDRGDIRILIQSFQC